MPATKSDRPKPRDKTFTFRDDPEVFAEAEARAEKEGRSLRDVLRAFLAVWGMGEYPSPPVMPGEGSNVRAAKRSKKKKPPE
jgi:hypothetical protein